MGQETVTAIVEQRGQITTNPAGFSPDTSRPIEQRDATPSTAAPSQPVQQLSSFKTATDGGNELSNPIEQQDPDDFNPLGTNPDDCFIEQKGVLTTDADGDSSIIQQLEFVTTTNTKPIEQFILSRNTATAQPLQQEPKESRTIQITQFDFAELIFPPCNSIKNPVTTNILWRIKDFGFTFDVETLIFIVNGVTVQDTSAFTVTAIVNGLQLDYNPPVNFDFDSTVTINLTISDNADPVNVFTYNCSWDTVEDSRPPIIDLISPECNSTAVSATAPVVFTVIDVGVGIDQESIQLSIEGIPVCSGLVFEGLTTISGNGFTGTWTHTDDPFRFDSSVSVSISATDLSPLENSSLFVCCFQTAESTAPDFINFNPEPCDSFVDNATNLCFEVYGDMDGIDISTLEVRIDNKLRKVLVRPRILRSE